MIGVVLADDDQILRAGLRLILESQPDLRVVAEAATGEEAVRACAGDRADVVLMDVRMPFAGRGTGRPADPGEAGGIEATHRLTAAGGRARVLVLTTFDTEDSLFAAVRAGASGFLLKRSSPEDLIAAVRAVAGGEGSVSPAVTRRLLAELAASAPPRPSAQVARRIGRLTEREREVLALLGRGRSTAEISAHLHVGDATTKTHVRRVLDKLELRDRVQAVVFAFDTGLVRPGDR